MNTSLEKCHGDQINFEDDEEEWNNRQYQKQLINQEE